MIVYGADDDIARWVSIGLCGKDNMFRMAKALGVVNNSKLIAGVVYHNYTETPEGKPLLCEMSIYSVDVTWANRQNLHKLFAYPFAQICLGRVQAICSANDEGVAMFLKRLGFINEGFHPRAHWDGGDALSFGMLKEQCKWVRHG